MTNEDKFNSHYDKLISLKEERADLVRQYNLSPDPSLEDQINDYDERIELTQNIINELEE